VGTSSSKFDLLQLFAAIERHGHEQVVFCRDRESGLRAIVAVHDTRLGPALGGIRVRDYAAEEDALIDVLKLSEAMSLKASLAGLDFGGGKAANDTERIEPTLRGIFAESKSSGAPPGAIALRLARARIEGRRRGA
jgi:glutamate dehydrogenase/leucine dehydrogenase